MEDKKKYIYEFKTRETMIASMKVEDDQAWADFYDKYAVLIVNFAIKRGCSKELADDVLQETTMALARYIKNFEYDPSKGRFKSLLFKITESKVIDAFRRSGKIIDLKDSEGYDHDPALHDESSNASEELWNQEWKDKILAQAVSDTKERVNLQTFQCFERAFLNEKPVKDIAEELGLSPNQVSQNKLRVMNMIIEIAKELMKSDQI